MKRRSGHRHAGLTSRAALALLLATICLPPGFVLLYALSQRWDRSLWPEGATLAWFIELGQDPRVAAAAARTLVIAPVSACLVTLAGTAATVAGHLYAPRLRAVLDALAQLPYAVPPVVVAISALDVFVGGLGGFIGQRLLYVLLLTPLLFPLVHRTVSAACLRLDLHTLLEAGRTLGATDAWTLRRVVLPLLAPAIGAAALLCLTTAALEFAVANLLLGGETELLQPLMNSLRATSGHRTAALVVTSFAIVGLLGALVQRLNRDPRP